jgi:CDP-diacylglycerol--serine O-phosphatidyltransferase
MNNHPVRTRDGLRKRAVIMLPNGFTLFNLFCGIHAIVLAHRGSTMADAASQAQLFGQAATWIVFGGIADMFDGRIARATGTGSPMGEELDSLVDAITFGLAPGLIMYFARLQTGHWQWMFVFLFSACAVMRLARFNVEQAGRPKTHFHGLPSPAAGLTLATYYHFAQTERYSQAVIWFTDATTLATLPWHAILPILMLVLALLMISNVPYPAVPTIGFRTPRQWAGTLIVLGSFAGVIFVPKEFLFPALVTYIAFGLVKSIGLGLLGRRRAADDSIYLEEEPNGRSTVAAVDRPARTPVERPVRTHERPRLPARAPGDTIASDSGTLEPGEAEREEREARRRRRRKRGGRSGGGGGGGAPRGPGSPPASSPPPSSPLP